MKIFLGLMAFLILVGVGGGAYFLYVKSLPVDNRPVIVREITKEVIVRTGGKVEEPKPPKKDPIEELNKKVDSLNKQLVTKEKYLETLRNQMTHALEEKKDHTAQGFSRGKSLSKISKDQSDIHQQQQFAQSLIKVQEDIKKIKYQITAAKRKIWHLQKKQAAAAAGTAPATDAPAAPATSE